MKISLPKSELEKFLELSNYTDLTPDSISYTPISEYILVQINRGFCKMTLTSNTSFVNYTFSISSIENQEFLISYLNLKKYFSVPRQDSITINDQELKISISDAIFTSSANKDVSIKIEEFPKIPQLAGINYKRINSKVIEQLKISRKYIMPENKDKLRPILNLISIKGDYMLSSDMQISCLFSLGESIQSEGELTVFSKKEIDLISNFDYFDYSKTNSWNIVKYKTIIYGSRLNDGIESGSMYEMMKLFVQSVDKDKVLKVNVKQFTNYCKSIKPYIKDETVNSYLEVLSENKIKLSYIDLANAIDEQKQEVDCLNLGYEIGYKICFSQANIVKVLDSLNSDLINISECQSEDGKRNYIGFWLDNDSSFHSICSKGFEATQG